MTPERQNEIWAMLPEDFKEQLCYDYNQANIALLQDPTNVRIDAHKRFLEGYFGTYNLTSQAEEKPKEDNGICKASDETLNKVQDGLHSIVKGNVNYQQYRLDLAKEIAVAMISSPHTWDFVPEYAVGYANEIVKRLKETEE